ncbi:hypothetical protein N431DRAFT_427431 [Stipitochalara longipes BDJ]|nr:hypothetical protein N431DRAFT_427431 [Stipitochalara longipes BDJ]
MARREAAKQSQTEAFPCRSVRSRSLVRPESVAPASPLLSTPISRPRPLELTGMSLASSQSRSVRGTSTVMHRKASARAGMRPNRTFYRCSCEECYTGGAAAASLQKRFLRLCLGSGKGCRTAEAIPYGDFAFAIRQRRGERKRKVVFCLECPVRAAWRFLTLGRPDDAPCWCLGQLLLLIFLGSEARGAAQIFVSGMRLACMTRLAMETRTGGERDEQARVLYVQSSISGAGVRFKNSNVKELDTGPEVEVEVRTILLLEEGACIRFMVSLIFSSLSIPTLLFISHPVQSINTDASIPS